MLKKLLPLLLICQAAYADSITVKMYETAEQDQGKYIGAVTFTDTPYGLLVTPNLYDLPPGPHGFHIHQQPSCQAMGQAAGGHLDPLVTNQHRGPYEQDGHTGDLPVLLVDKQGNAISPALAPRLTTQELRYHSVMIHAGSDNYADKPEKLGGGGARIACGVVF